MVGQNKQKQNEFYFEASTLLKDMQIKDDLKYRELYEKIPVVLLLGWTGAKGPLKFFKTQVSREI